MAQKTVESSGILSSDIRSSMLMSENNAKDISNTDSASTTKIFSNIVLLATSTGLEDYRRRLKWLSNGEVIGQGSCFTVEARKGFLSPEAVAIKHSRIRSHGDDREEKLRTLRALQVVFQEMQVLTHRPIRESRYIIKLLGFGWNGEMEGPEFFLVQELAESSLVTFLQAGSVSLKQRGQFCLDICTGLTALHESSILHGDVKQDNVLVFRTDNDTYVCKVADFGHSIALGNQEEARQYVGGTPLYAAPEYRQPSLVAFDEKLFAGDVFSFGILALEIWIHGKRFYSLFSNLASSDTPKRLQALCAMAPDSILEKAQQSLAESIINPTEKSKLISLYEFIFDSTLHNLPHRRLSMNEIINHLNGSKDGTSTASNSSTSGERLNISYANALDPVELSKHHYPWDLQKQVFMRLEQNYHNDDNSEYKASTASILSICYRIGWGVPKDQFQALKYLKEAAGAGDPRTCLVASRLLASFDDQDPALFSNAPEIPLLNLTKKLECVLTKKPNNAYFAELIQFISPQLLQVPTPSSHLGFSIIPITSHSFLQLLPPSIDFEMLCSKAQEFGLNRFHAIVRSDRLELLRSVCNSTPQYEMSLLLGLKDSMGRSATLHACEAGNLNALKILAEHKPTLSDTDFRNRCCFHWLCAFPSSEVEAAGSFMFDHAPETLNSVAKFGRDLTTGWLQGGTPLHCAVAANNVDVVSLLLRMGADPRVAVHWPSSISLWKLPPGVSWDDREGFTAIPKDFHLLSALDVAIRLHLPGITRILIKNLGLDILSDLSLACRMWHHACSVDPHLQRRLIHGREYENAYSETLELLNLEQHPYSLFFSEISDGKHFELMTAYWENLIPFTIGQRLQEEYMVKILLNKLALYWNIAIGNCFISHPLRAASFSLTEGPMDLGIFPLLLSEYGCELHWETFDELTTSIIAGKGSTSLLKIVLDLQNECSTSPQQRMNVLKAAITQDQTASLKLLLERGFGNEAFDDNNFTPLHVAAAQGALECTRILLQWGASPFTENIGNLSKSGSKRRLTIFHSALNNHNPNGIIQYILTVSQRTPWGKRIRKVLESPEPQLGLRPLHIAVCLGDLPAVISLVRAGAVPAYCESHENNGSIEIHPTGIALYCIEIDNPLFGHVNSNHAKKQIPLIYDYLTKIREVQNKEYQKLCSAHFGNLFQSTKPEDNDVLRLLRDKGLLPLDDVAEDEMETNIEDYEQESKDIFTASVISIKRRIQETPIPKFYLETAEMFQKLANIAAGVSDPGLCHCTNAVLSLGFQDPARPEKADFHRELARRLYDFARYYMPFNGCTKCKHFVQENPSILESHCMRSDGFITRQKMWNIPSSDSLDFLDSNELDALYTDDETKLKAHTHILEDTWVPTIAQRAFVFQVAQMMRANPDWETYTSIQRTECLEILSTRMQNWRPNVFTLGFLTSDGTSEKETNVPETSVSMNSTKQEAEDCKEQREQVNEDDRDTNTDDQTRLVRSLDIEGLFASFDESIASHISSIKNPFESRMESKKQ